MSANDVALNWYASPLDPDHKKTLIQFFDRWQGAAWAAVFSPFAGATISGSDDVHFYLSNAEGSARLVDLTCTIATNVITATTDGSHTQPYNGSLSWLLWNNTSKKELAWGTTFLHPNTLYVGAFVPTPSVTVTSYSGLIGDGVATSYTIPQSTHKLAANGKLMVSVADASSGVIEYPTVSVNNSNGTVTIVFSSAPTSNSKRVLILGASA